MEEISLLELSLQWVVAYGPWVLGTLLFIGAAGVPLPGMLLVMAAGAFVRQGVFDIQTAVLIALAGAVAGDSLSYGMGFAASGWTQRRLGGTVTWQRAHKAFLRRGWLAVYLTRFLITPLAIPTNLIAGSTGYAYGLFVLFDLLGEVTWIALYGSLGYLFSSQWELIGELVSDLVGLLGGVAILGLAVYFAAQLRARRAVAAKARRNQPEVST